MAVPLASVEDDHPADDAVRSEEHTSELQSLRHLVCRLLLEKKRHEPFLVSPTLALVQGHERSLLQAPSSHQHISIDQRRFSVGLIAWRPAQVGAEALLTYDF